MKKILIILLASLMMVSLVACQKDAKNEDIAITEDMSVVEKLDTVFKNMSDDEGVTAEAMLEQMREYLPAELSVDIASVEEVFNGFDETITDYDKATVLMPMISVIPFICYIFEVSEDIDGFAKNVEGLANTGWNICVTADDLLVDQSNGYVLVVMAPTTFDE